MSRVFVAGSLNVDLVIDAPRLPRPGETLSGGDLRIHPGGKGANQAVAAARLGAETAMIGAVGDDAFGRMLIAELRGAGIDASGVSQLERPTGAAQILVLPKGENAIVVSPGANALLTVERALQGLADLAAGDLLLCQLESPLETVDAALQFARGRGATTMLDPAPARPLSRKMLAEVDILTPNQAEAAALLGRPAPIQADRAEQAAAELRRLGPRAVIVKLGAAGCFVADRDGGRLIPAFDVEPIDATGAGDVFNGATAAALAAGASLTDAARFACAAAALSTTRRGAQTSAPSRSEAAALYDFQRPNQPPSTGIVAPVT